MHPLMNVRRLIVHHSDSVSSFRPANPSIDIGDLRLRHAEVIRYRGLSLTGCETSSYFNHIAQRELCLSCAFTTRHAALVCGVDRVVFRRSEKQVRRIDASPIIASMKNEHTCRDWALVNLVGNAMDVTLSELGPAESDCSVPASAVLCDWELSTGPFPATGFQLPDLCHQPCSYRSELRRHDSMNSKDTQ